LCEGGLHSGRQTTRTLKKWRECPDTRKGVQIVRRWKPEPGSEKSERKV